MTDKVNNLRRIESLMKLMKDYRINEIEVDGIKIVKVYHDPIQHEAKHTPRDNSSSDAWLDPLGVNYDKYSN